MKAAVKYLFVFVLVSCLGCATHFYNETRKPAADQEISTSGVEAYLDSQYIAMKFNPGVVGDLPVNQLKGDALKQFQTWASEGNGAQATRMDYQSTGIWVVFASVPDSEVGGNFVPYISIFSITDGSILASGNIPHDRQFKQGILWDGTPRVGAPQAAAPFVPTMKPPGAGVNSDSLISSILGEFDEKAIRNKIYTGNDLNGNPEKMTWQVTKASGKRLSVQLQNQNSAFQLDSSTQIISTNIDQFTNDSEGSFLVITTSKATFWLHVMEGNTTIKIVQGPKDSSFQFNEDLQ